MVVIYRLLGMFALIGQRTSRIRINFVPINWGIMGALLIGCAVSWANAAEGFSNGPKPVKVTVDDIVSRRVDFSHNYVQVSGTLFSDSAITATYKSKYETNEDLKTKDPTDAWVPLAAPNKRGGISAIMVKLEQATTAGDQPHAVTVSGLLKPIDTDLQKELDKDPVTEKDSVLDREYVLEENGVPGNGWSWTIATIISGVAFAGMALTFLMRYIVFQKQDVFSLPQPGPVSAATFDRGETVARATGQFHFVERNISQRFLNVPVLVTQAEDGSAVLVANVDASQRFGIFTTDRRNGYWVVPLGHLAGHPVDKGTLYLGASASPSLRIKTVASAENGPANTVILSTASDAERDQLIQALVTPRTPRASDNPYTTTTAPVEPLPFDL